MSGGVHASSNDDHRPARCALAIATVLGIGYARPAPGTWASAATALACYAAMRVVPSGWLQAAFAVAAIVATAVGVPAATRAARHLGCADPSQVVIDEVVGVLIAMAIVPGATIAAHPAVVAVVACAAFRLFDIAKPWPVSWLERLPAGWGIVLDDAAAGALAGCLTASTMG